MKPRYTSKYEIYGPLYYESNLSLTEFCKINNLSYWGFHEWLRHVAPTRPHTNFDMAARRKRIRAYNEARQKRFVTLAVKVFSPETWTKVTINNQAEPTEKSQRIRNLAEAIIKLIEDYDTRC